MDLGSAAATVQVRVASMANWVHLPPLNVPGGRQASVSWIDNSGNFWLFGGYDLSPTNQPNAFNDLWGVSAVVNGLGSVAPIFVNQTANVWHPGCCRSDKCPPVRGGALRPGQTAMENLWLFGGFGYDATGKRYSR